MSQFIVTIYIYLTFPWCTFCIFQLYSIGFSPVRVSQIIIISATFIFIKYNQLYTFDLFFFDKLPLLVLPLFLLHTIILLPMHHHVMSYADMTVIFSLYSLCKTKLISLLFLLLLFSGCGGIIPLNQNKSSGTYLNW